MLPHTFYKDEKSKDRTVANKNGEPKKCKVINARSKTGSICKYSYWRSDHRNVETVTIWETLAMPEELGSGKLIDINKKSSCDEKNKDV